MLIYKEASMRTITMTTMMMISMISSRRSNRQRRSWWWRGWRRKQMWRTRRKHKTGENGYRKRRM
jgi:hypothetical protein